MVDPSVDILARTLWGEARGEGMVGQKAVANVIMNRVKIGKKHKHFGIGTIRTACLEPWQFSCHNIDDPNCLACQRVTMIDPVFVQCLQIAQLAVDGSLGDITGGATYYYAQGSPVPTWAEGKIPCAVIGKHLFFKNIQ